MRINSRLTPSRRARSDRLVISNVGDVLINNPPTGSPTDAVALLRSSDAVFGNLEGPATDRGVQADKWIALRHKPSLLSEYKKMNFAIFTVANNHMLDYGQVGLLDTLHNLKAMGFRYVGAGRDIREALQPSILASK